MKKCKGVVLLAALGIVWVISAVGIVTTAAVVHNNQTTTESHQ